MKAEGDGKMMRTVRALQRIQLRVELLRDRVVADQMLKGLEDDAEQGQTARRMLVRSFASWVEGDTNVRIDVLLDEDEQRPILSAPLKSLMREERLSIAKDGSPKIGRARFPILARLRLSLRGYMEMFKEFSPDFFRPEQAQGWRDLERVIEIRNRIVHPREKKAFFVSDEEVALTREAEEWYDEMTDGLFTDEKG